MSLAARRSDAREPLLPQPASIRQAAELLRQGVLTPRALVEGCLARIDRFESRVQAWVLVDRQGALAAADRLADELAQGRDRGPLHGVPLGIKDIIDVAGWPTLAGSSLRDGHLAAADAPLVAGLRQAGAIFLGKTVTTQWASFDPPPTRNPWSLECTPAGSSSGSAAAVAGGMCFAAIGSQTGGSITRPASYCGVAGLKPTYGRVSLAGIIPLAPRMDHPGPLARTAADLGPLLAALAASQADDPLCRLPSLTIDARRLDGRGESPRLAVWGGMFHEHAEPEVRRVMVDVAERLAQHGAQLVARLPPPSFDRVNLLHRRIMAVEAACVHRQAYPARAETFGPQISRLLDEGRGTSALDYAEALAAQEPLRRELLAALDGFDAILTPAATSTAPPLARQSTGDPRFNSPFSMAGFPTVSVLGGLADNGLPVGIQLVGRPFDEAALIAAAAWCEDHLGTATLEPPLLTEA